MSEHSKKGKALARLSRWTAAGQIRSKDTATMYSNRECIIYPHILSLNFSVAIDELYDMSWVCLANVVQWKPLYNGNH